TLALVREVADGWVMLRSGNPETLERVLEAPDWPRDRHMTVARTASVYVGASEAEALREAEKAVAAGQSGPARTLEDVQKTAFIGTPSALMARFAELESWGINYLRLSFWTEAQQTLFAESALTAPV